MLKPPTFIAQQSQTQKNEVLKALRLFARSINSGNKANPDMSALINVTSQLPLSNFNYWERLIRTEFTHTKEEYKQINWKFWAKPREVLTWLDLISWDGYRRERVLRTLSGAAPNSFFFSLAIRRLNDWVPQVRQAAREKLPEIAQATNSDYVVDALCILFSHWNSWGRIEEVDKQILLQIISSDELSKSLKSRLLSSTTGSMAFLFSQLGRTSILDNDLLELACSAIQPSIRARAYRCLLEGRISWTEGHKWEWTDIRYCKGRHRPITSDRKINVQLHF